MESGVDVPDIEDMCTLCEPLSENFVTTYPMKAERKKAREELDIVNVVEWRSDKERLFLLVRRPEGGTLFYDIGNTKADPMLTLLKVFWLV
jgi:A/G-specific adenine glycosylase